MISFSQSIWLIYLHPAQLWVICLIKELKILHELLYTQCENAYMFSDWPAWANGTIIFAGAVIGMSLTEGVIFFKK